MEFAFTVLLGIAAGVLANFLSYAFTRSFRERRSDVMVVRLPSGEAYQVPSKNTPREQIDRTVRSFLYASDAEPSLLEVQEVDLIRDIVEPVTAELRARSREADVSLVYDSAVRPKLRGDRDALRQVFFNILQNSLKYSPRGSRIRVRAEEGPAGVRVVVENPVASTLDADEAERIFERGFRSREAVSVDPHGLGLGLWVATRLVAAHRGSIQVQPGDGKFSVEVQFPRDQ